MSNVVFPGQSQDFFFFSCVNKLLDVAKSGSCCGEAADSGWWAVCVWVCVCYREKRQVFTMWGRERNLCKQTLRVSVYSCLFLSQTYSTDSFFSAVYIFDLAVVRCLTWIRVRMKDMSFVTVIITVTSERLHPHTRLSVRLLPSDYT